MDGQQASRASDLAPELLAAADALVARLRHEFDSTPPGAERLLLAACIQHVEMLRTLPEYLLARDRPQDTATKEPESCDSRAKGLPRSA